MEMSKAIAGNRSYNPDRINSKRSRQRKKENNYVIIGNYRIYKLFLSNCLLALAIIVLVMSVASIISLNNSLARSKNDISSLNTTLVSKDELILSQQVEINTLNESGEKYLANELLLTEEITKLSTKNEELTLQFNSSAKKIEETLVMSALEMDVFLKILEAEARGQGLEGQIAVAAVILNRVESSKFPNTIEDVVFAANQFEPVATGTFYQMVPDAQTYEAASRALAGEDPTGGALYFYNPSMITDEDTLAWFDTLQTTATIGSHVFKK